MNVRKVAEGGYYSDNSIKPVLCAGQVMKLDDGMQNGSMVKVVQQTKGRLYTEVEGDDGDRWWVMSYRLTLPCI
jgi:hypothetical protein